MKHVAIVVPVKGRRYKSRLSKNIGPPERLTLSSLLLKDLLETIASTGMIAGTFVVSSSRSMRKLAQGLGANTIEESKDDGVNAAVGAAMRSLADYQEFLILPSDLPLLKPTDIRKAIALKREGMNIVISPSAAFDGTNLLLVSRSHPIELSYDNDSFWNHLRSAATKRLSVAVYTSRGVMMDLDTEKDVVEVLNTKVNRESTAFLRERSGFE
jgi:2-phospho-L-lactate guanylyltransferase